MVDDSIEVPLDESVVDVLTVVSVFVGVFGDGSLGGSDGSSEVRTTCSVGSADGVLVGSWDSCSTVCDTVPDSCLGGSGCSSIDIFRQVLSRRRCNGGLVWSVSSYIIDLNQ